MKNIYFFNNQNKFHEYVWGLYECNGMCMSEKKILETFAAQKWLFNQSGLNNSECSSHKLSFKYKNLEINLIYMHIRVFFCIVTHMAVLSQ